jgi:hypothetical protein
MPIRPPAISVLEPETPTKGLTSDGSTQEKALEHAGQEAPHKLETRNAVPVALPPLQPAQASAPRVWHCGYYAGEEVISQEASKSA